MSFLCPHNGGPEPCMHCDNEMLVKDNQRLRDEITELMTLTWPAEEWAARRISDDDLRHQVERFRQGQIGAGI